jgi:ComF family protein
MDEPLAEFPGLLQSARHRVRLAMQKLVDVVTPPKCLVCSQSVATGASLCVTCWQKLVTIDEPVCDALGLPFEYDQGEGMLSAAAIAEPPAWDRGRAAVVFDDAAKTLVHLLKYSDQQEAGIAMARMMVQAGRRLIADCDLVVPVPLHRVRLWQRRFNQSAYLAHRIAQQTGKPCRTDVLLREKRTRQQVGLTADERRRNVRRAFAVPLELKTHVDGRRILLIDDVRTTGATLTSCTEALRKAGADHVDVLTFALVPEPLRPHIDA